MEILFLHFQIFWFYKTFVPPQGVDQNLGVNQLKEVAVFRIFFLFLNENHGKHLKINKKRLNQFNKNLTSFWVRAAPKTLSKHRTLIAWTSLVQENKNFGNIPKNLNDCILTVVLQVVRCQKRLIKNCVLSRRLVNLTESIRPKIGFEYDPNRQTLAVKT